MTDWLEIATDWNWLKTEIDWIMTLAENKGTEYLVVLLMTNDQWLMIND